jgi:hypothetical protein
MRESNVLPRFHPMRLRIAKPFNDPNYIFELKQSRAIKPPKVERSSDHAIYGPAGEENLRGLRQSTKPWPG